MWSMLRRVLRQESGQDLVEYGLLVFFVVLASIAVWNTIAVTVGVVYNGYDANTQGLWEPPDPGGA